MPLTRATIRIIDSTRGHVRCRVPGQRVGRRRPRDDAPVAPSTDPPEAGREVLLPLSVLVAVTFSRCPRPRAARPGAPADRAGLATSGPTGLITALQNERAWPAAELVGFDDFRPCPSRATRRPGRPPTRPSPSFRADLEAKPPVVAEAYDEALAGSTARAIRADIDANTVPRDLENLVFSDLIFARYSDLVEPFYEATARIASVSTTRTCATAPSWSTPRPARSRSWPSCSTPSSATALHDGIAAPWRSRTGRHDRRGEGNAACLS